MNHTPTERSILVATVLRLSGAAIAILVVGTTYLVFALGSAHSAPRGSAPAELVPWTSEGSATFPGFGPGLILAAAFYAAGTAIAIRARQARSSVTAPATIATAVACTGLVLLSSVSVFDGRAWLHVTGVHLFVVGSLAGEIAIAREMRSDNTPLLCVIALQLVLLCAIVGEAAGGAAHLDPVQHFVGRTSDNRLLRELEPALVTLLALGWLYAARFYAWRASGVGSRDTMHP